MAIKLSTALLVVAATASVAAAEPTVTVTTNPVLVAIGTPDVTVEARVDDHIGIAPTVGYCIACRANTGRSQLAGGSFNYYVFRQFAGLHVGVESFYLHREDNSMPAPSWDTWWVVGGYVGYKWIHSSGFTASIQGGVGFVDAQSSDPEPYYNFKSAAPLLHTQLGYSF